MLFAKPLNLLFYGLTGLLLLSSCKEDSKTASEHTFTNDLVHETSPYLLQHAHNPVHWRAWNPEIFEEAQKANKLVLVSIGYSSCHWGHVMERETFEDEEVAKLMNDNFISIKVDREERPDVDQVYQTAIQLIGQNGGWPLNVITLPNGKPLYLGTYLPKEQWNLVLSKVNQMYTENPEEANTYANELSRGIQETNLFEVSSDFEKLTKEAVKSGVQNWKQQWDLELGGNQGSQKFMIPNALSFLLDYAILEEDESALQYVENTLDKMAQGGIYDHVGGGFYRYSTDPQWSVPHFEKMLYDNAQAISLYAKAYTIFQKPAYKDVVYESIAYLEREMKHEGGGYYATLDADSDGEEGQFYVWTLPELQSVLEEDMPLFSSYYNMNQENSWEKDTYILHAVGDDASFLKSNSLSAAEFTKKKKIWKTKLLEARTSRVRPTTDDKILTSWNALLINGLTDAYTAFGEESFLKRATSIYNFIKTNSYADGHLLHSFKEGSKRKEGFLEDYAFLIDASLKLYSTTLDTAYLDFSEELTTIVMKDFSDTSSGMFTFNKDQKLISRIIKTNDGDIPSPNSVMAHNLLQLGHINYNTDYINQSKTMLTTLLPLVTEYTDGYAHWSSLLLHVTHPYFEIAVVGENSKSLVRLLQEKHLPNTLIVGTAQESEAELFKDRYVEGETFIYVCQNSTCKLPVKTVEEALQQLESF